MFVKDQKIRGIYSFGTSDMADFPLGILQEIDGYIWDSIILNEEEID